MSKIKVHFEDQGQDLLWFIIDDETGEILEAGPFHNSVYKSKWTFGSEVIEMFNAVLYHTEPVIDIYDPERLAQLELMEIRYPVVKIEEVAA